MYRTIAALVAVFIIAAACGSEASSSPSPDPGSSAIQNGSGVDATGDWTLTAGTLNAAPVPMVAGNPITLTVAGSMIAGTSACNRYFGEVTVQNGVVVIAGLGGTEMACRDDVMASESAYTTALLAVRGARRDSIDLILFGEAVELRFAPVAPPPTTDMVGTVWVLDSLVEGDAVSSVAGEPATFELRADGTLAGSTGCRTFMGRYIITGDQILATDLSTDDRACATGLERQDGHVLEVIGDGFGATVDGDRMTLVSRDRNGLVYRPR